MPGRSLAKPVIQMQAEHPQRHDCGITQYTEAALPHPTPGQPLRVERSIDETVESLAGTLLAQIVLFDRKLGKELFEDCIGLRRGQIQQHPFFHFVGLPRRALVTHITTKSIHLRFVHGFVFSGILSIGFIISTPYGRRTRSRPDIFNGLATKNRGCHASGYKKGDLSRMGEASSLVVRVLVVIPNFRLPVSAGRGVAYRILRMILSPWRIASSFCGSIFHARSGSDFFKPTMTFSISTTGQTLR